MGSRSVYSTALSSLLLNLNSFRKVWVPGLCTPLQCLHCCSTSTPSGRCGFQVSILHFIVSTSTRPKLLQEGVGSKSVYSTPLSPLLLNLTPSGRCGFQVCILHFIVSTATRPKLLQEGVGSRSVYSTSLSPLLLNLSSFRKVWVPGLCTPLHCLHCCST